MADLFFLAGDSLRGRLTDTEENRARNRRVDIVILNQPVETPLQTRAKEAEAAAEAAKAPQAKTEAAKPEGKKSEAAPAKKH